jgi:hypothetical protein
MDVWFARDCRFVPKNRLQVDSPPASMNLDMSVVVIHPDTADGIDVRASRAAHS